MGREIWRETIFLRSIRDSFGKPFSATSSTEISRIRAFRQPILVAFRVGVIITSVVYMEREERGKRSIEEERVKMRFVIARHVDRGNALFFFFFKEKTIRCFHFLEKLTRKISSMDESFSSKE